MNLRSTITVATICALGAAVLTGCARDEPESEVQEELPVVSIEDYADVAAELDFEHAVAVLPIDRYDLGSPDYVIRVLHAIAVRADGCMADAGYPEIASSIDWSPYQEEEDRTYGLWSVPYASKYGTMLAPTAGAPKLDTLSMGVEFNKQYPICMGSAKESLMDELLFSQELDVDYKIRRKAHEMTLASDEGKQARTDWSSCMEERGLVLDSSDGRPSEQYKNQGKEAEIQAIVLEAECASSSGAIQTLYNIQARYEAAYIDAQAAQLEAFSEQRNRAIEVFEDAIAGR